jgi:predicted regulator of Ras-like GTPase activity (Roadblock/LC7/MglB family)
MNKAGGFQVSLLTSTDGLPIATVPAAHDSDFMAAMVALIQMACNDAQGQLGMANVDEVTIRDCDHTRLVCRYVVIGNDKLILSAMVPASCAYRRVTNQAIRRIKRMLS